jgi:hypothetical protein
MKISRACLKGMLAVAVTSVCIQVAGAADQPMRAILCIS